MKSHYIISTILILLLIVSGVFYFRLCQENKELRLQVLEFTQEIYDLKEQLKESEEVVDWKSFETADFSVKYPPDYLKREEEYSRGGIGEYAFHFAPTKSDLAAFEKMNYSWIAIEKITNSVAIENVKSEAKKDKVGSYNVTSSDLTVDGMPATKSIFKTPDDTGFVQVSIEKDDNLFTLTLHSFENDRMIIFEKMLSTFNFLE